MLTCGYFISLQTPLLVEYPKWSNVADKIKKGNMADLYAVYHKPISLYKDRRYDGDTVRMPAFAYPNVMSNTRLIRTSLR